MVAAGELRLVIDADVEFIAGAEAIGAGWRRGQRRQIIARRAQAGAAAQAAAQATDKDTPFDNRWPLKLT
jgi:hypothetical protein